MVYKDRIVAIPRRLPPKGGIHKKGRLIRPNRALCNKSHYQAASNTPFTICTKEHSAEYIASTEPYNVFTDGSFKHFNSKAGYGVFYDNQGFSKHVKHGSKLEFSSWEPVDDDDDCLISSMAKIDIDLAKHKISALTMEFLAILEAIVHVQSTWKHDQLYIYTDCLSALKHLIKFSANPPRYDKHRFKQILEAIVEAACNSKIKEIYLFKVKAHSNISGNVEADRLADIGARACSPAVNGVSGQVSQVQAQPEFNNTSVFPSIHQHPTYSVICRPMEEEARNFYQSLAHDRTTANSLTWQRPVPCGQGVSLRPSQQAPMLFPGMAQRIHESVRQQPSIQQGPAPTWTQEEFGHWFEARKGIHNGQPGISTWQLDRCVLARTQTRELGQPGKQPSIQQARTWTQEEEFGHCFEARTGIHNGQPSISTQQSERCVLVRTQIRELGQPGKQPSIQQGPARTWTQEEFGHCFEARTGIHNRQPSISTQQLDRCVLARTQTRELGQPGKQPSIQQGPARTWTQKEFGHCFEARTGIHSGVSLWKQPNWHRNRQPSISTRQSDRCVLARTQTRELGQPSKQLSSLIMHDSTRTRTQERLGSSIGQECAVQPMLIRSREEFVCSSERLRAVGHGSCGAEERLDSSRSNVVELGSSVQQPSPTWTLLDTGQPRFPLDRLTRTEAQLSDTSNRLTRTENQVIGQLRQLRAVGHGSCGTEGKLDSSRSRVVELGSSVQQHSPTWTLLDTGQPRFALDRLTRTDASVTLTRIENQVIGQLTQCSDTRSSRTETGSWDNSIRTGSHEETLTGEGTTWKRDSLTQEDITEDSHSVIYISEDEDEPIYISDDGEENGESKQELEYIPLAEDADVDLEWSTGSHAFLLHTVRMNTQHLRR